jgi:SAM-dependent methyltransferase
MAHPHWIDVEVIEAYAATRQALIPFLEQLDIQTLSKHNTGYLHYASDPIFFFLDLEKHKYYYLLDYILRHFERSSKILDVGFFIPVIPIALSKLGYSVTSIEKMALYDDALLDLAAFVESTCDVRVWDQDIIYDSVDPAADKFDLIILSAIIEHLNGSPKILFEKAKAFGKPDAHYIITVPNAASLEKRLRFFLKGKPPYPPIEDYYDSAYPFSGHNREYSLDDFKYVLDRSGFEPVLIQTHNRRPGNSVNFMQKILNLIAVLGPESWKSSLFADVMRNPSDRH